MKRILILLFCFLFFGSHFSFAQNVDNVDLHLFYGEGCPHCEKAILFLNDLEFDYSALNVVLHETYFNDSQRELFLNLTHAYGREVEGVPTIFIGDEVFVGFSDSISKEIENKINECIIDACDNPIDRLDALEPDNNLNLSEKITIPAVILAALVDAINPCAFAVLIILLMTILASKKRSQALFSGLAFSLSIFISYFLMGIGLYSVIQVSGFSHIFYLVVAILAIFIGLLNLKDYFSYGKWFVMEVPLKWRPKMKSLIGGVTSIYGAFGIGFLVSLFLLPCTSGPYIIILGLLSHVATRTQALSMLILYNFIFVLPMILITLAVYFGITTTEKAEKLRQNKLEILHLIAGIIILILGIGMLLAIKLGMI